MHKITKQKRSGCSGSVNLLYVFSFLLLGFHNVASILLTILYIDVLFARTPLGFSLFTQNPFSLIVRPKLKISLKIHLCK